MNGEKIQEKLIHNFFCESLVTGIILEKNKTLDTLCLYLSNEKNVLQIYKIEKYEQNSNNLFEKKELMKQPIEIKRHNLMK